MGKKGKARKGKAEKKTLADFPRPPVAVDTAVLTVLPPEAAGRGELAVLVIRRAGRHRKGEWSLPGTFLHEGELLSESVARSLRDKAGLGDDVVPRQLRVFDAVDRDTRGRVLSVAHKVWVPYGRLAPVVEAGDGGMRLLPVDEVGPMTFDHSDIVSAAVDQARAEYAREADPGHLLPGSFTLHELWVVHDAVAGHYDSSEDAFRLRAVRMLEPAPEPPRRLDVGRPARLYRRR